MKMKNLIKKLRNYISSSTGTFGTLIDSNGTNYSGNEAINAKIEDFGLWGSGSSPSDSRDKVYARGKLIR